MRDIDVRSALLTRLACLHPDKGETLIVEELGVCQGLARVDVAVVNGRIHGFEIKSERDTLLRLKAQAEIYSKALEYVTIVAASCHVAAIGVAVPPWWGIWTATQNGEDVELEEIREAHANPELMRDALVQFLWRDEALNILQEHELARGVAGKSRHHIWERLSESFSADDLGAMVRLRLKQRPAGWRVVS